MAIDDWLKPHLDQLYHFYNSRCRVHPDPLEFLYHYPALKDREIAVLVAACMAYGRVDMILKTVSSVLTKMGPSPRAFLEQATLRDFKRTFHGFKYRFTTDDEVACLLSGIKQVIDTYGTLHACFLEGLDPRDDTILSGLCFLAHTLRIPFRGPNSLMPDPKLGSACKRLNLFFRWMVRQDGVDPGGWDPVLCAKLIVPLDTHMYRLSTRLGLTCRKTPDMRTAMEITRGFSQVCPEDPVQYDFALTRLGIRQDKEMEGFLDHCKGLGMKRASMR